MRPRSGQETLARPRPKSMKPRTGYTRVYRKERNVQLFYSICKIKYKNSAHPAYNTPKNTNSQASTAVHQSRLLFERKLGSKINEDKVFFAYRYVGCKAKSNHTAAACQPQRCRL